MAQNTNAKKSTAPKKQTSKAKATKSKKSPAKSTKNSTAPKKTIPKKAASKPAEQHPLFRKKTIAERTVAWKTRNHGAILAWLGMIFFSLLAAFFFFAVVGYSFSGLVCLCIVAIIAFYKFTRYLSTRFPSAMGTLRQIFSTCLCIGLLIVTITLGIVVEASFGDPEQKVDYMVVLGAGVHGNEPSLSLQNRIDTAYQYLTANPEVIAVLSGGQGEGENITEAQCMYDHLTKMGINPSRLWMEDQATSTWENLNFTLNLIEEKTGTRPEKLGVLSSEYHLYRASLFTEECGAEFIGIPAKTTKISLRINYFMREVAGVWHYLILGGQYDA